MEKAGVIYALPLIALALIEGAAACSSLPPEPTTPPSDIIEPSRESDPDTRPYTEEEKTQSHGKLGGVWVTCYRSLTTGSASGPLQNPGSEGAPADPETELARLTAACGRPTGLSAVTNLHTGESQSEKDASERFTFRARAGRCYRVFAVGGPGVRDLDVAIVGSDGRLVAADVSRDRWPVVPPRGPLCFDREGSYSIEVAVTEGSGNYLIQVWGDDGAGGK